MTWLFTTTDFLKVGSIQKILIVAGAREKSCKRRDGKHESAQDTLPRNSAETAGVVGVIPVVAHNKILTLWNNNLRHIPVHSIGRVSVEHNIGLIQSLIVDINNSIGQRYGIAGQTNDSLLIVDFAARQNRRLLGWILRVKQHNVASLNVGHDRTVEG